MKRIAVIVGFVSLTAGVASADLPGPFSPRGGAGAVVIGVAVVVLVVGVVLVVRSRRRREPPG